MARRLRFQLANYPLHIVQRGVDRTATFRAPEDYRLYLGLLQELAPLFACDVHSYVLMTNHVHLLATPRVPRACSALMKNLGQRYAQAINRRWVRSGPLWEGRFKCCVVDTTTYALTCQRYIERNPVRARMVRHPAEYGWSSFRRNAFGTPCPIVTPLVVYRNLGGDEESRRLAYRSLFDEDEDALTLRMIRRNSRSGEPLGEEGFAKRIARLVVEASNRRFRREGELGL